MLSNLTTRFVGKLKARDPQAWFELWETFGPVLRAQIGKWGYGWIGPETVQDLSQETLAALSNCIDKHDPRKGARFSTWLLTIARYTLTDELDRRTAKKRGGGKRTTSLDEAWSGPSRQPAPDQDYEAAIFRSKVEAAVRRVEKESDFLEFQVFRMRVLDGMSGKDVATALGLSEPKVSRQLKKIRSQIRKALEDVVSTFSFTEEEKSETECKGIVLNPNKADDNHFDAALAEILKNQEVFRRSSQSKNN